jgi:hypothetical protein
MVVQDWPDCTPKWDCVGVADHPVHVHAEVSSARGVDEIEQRCGSFIIRRSCKQAAQNRLGRLSGKLSVAMSK